MYSGFRVLRLPVFGVSQIRGYLFRGPHLQDDSTLRFLAY